MNACIRVVCAHGTDRSHQRRVAHESFCVGEVQIIQLIGDVALAKHCESFVDPQICPVVGIHPVPEPRVANCMDHSITLDTVVTWSWKQGGEDRW